MASEMLGRYLDRIEKLWLELMAEGLSIGDYRQALETLEACRDLLILCYKFELEIGRSGSNLDGINSVRQ